jgi:hypothetical protein
VDEKIIVKLFFYILVESFDGMHKFDIQAVGIHAPVVCFLVHFGTPAHPDDVILLCGCKAKNIPFHKGYVVRIITIKSAREFDHPLPYRTSSSSAGPGRP